MMPYMRCSEPGGVLAYGHHVVGGRVCEIPMPFIGLPSLRPARRVADASKTLSPPDPDPLSPGQWGLDTQEFLPLAEKFVFSAALIYEQNRIVVCRAGRSSRRNGQEPG